MIEHILEMNREIHLEEFNSKHRCICDECNSIVDDRFGDPRQEVFRFDSKYTKDPSSIRMLCSYCIDDLFGDHEPHSIFG